MLNRFKYCVMSTAQALRNLLLNGPMPAGQLISALDTSKASLSRLVSSTPGVLRLGRARATKYALAREIRTMGSRWPVYRVDVRGRAELLGHLQAIEPRAWLFEWVGVKPDWLIGQFAEGLFPDLPWFLDDLRPQGFVGRAFARRYSEMLGLSPDPRLWDAAGVLVALLSFGDDLPGDLIVGDQSLERFQRAALRQPPAIPCGERTARYEENASAALQGEMPGSSAAGEQPKFTACVEDADGPRHVLVKFSPLLDTPSGRRWGDLLVCEHLAAELLREEGFPACDTQVLEGGGRRFLEVTRFDRVGAFGRRGFTTLMPLDSAHYGKLDTWLAAAERLAQDGWLTAETATRLRLLWWFGGLIGNSDMHFGNVGITLDALPAQLAPAYDMLPMLFRPEAGGEIVARSFAPPLPNPGQVAVWRQAAELAGVFWQRVISDGRIGAEMRVEAERSLDVLRRARERIG